MKRSALGIAVVAALVTVAAVRVGGWAVVTVESVPDYLVVGNYLFAKADQPKLADDSDWRKEFKLD